MLTLYRPPSDVRVARHAIVVVGGFLSAGYDCDSHKDDWQHIVHFCRVRRIPLYVFVWEAKNVSELGEVA